MQIENLSATLSVLSAMVTPAVLILASSSLVLATSNRLSRAVDRTRAISERITEAAKEEERTLLPEERDLLLQQLDRTARRAKLLTRSLTRLYTALAIFIATSMAIGVVAVTGVAYAWVALFLGFVGALLLFWSSVLLIMESRIALTAVYDEMEFVQRLGQRHTPPGNLVTRTRRPRWRRG
jgi:Flp pilus assembly protein TadB